MAGNVSGCQPGGRGGGTLPWPSATSRPAAQQGAQKSPTQDNWFVAVMLPAEASARVQAVIDDVSGRFGTGVSTAAPHITLVPPFRMSTHNLPALETALTAFAGSRAAAPARLTGFSCFEPRVVYVNVEHGEVAGVRADLNAALGCACPFVRLDRRPFKPHITVASKRVTPEKFAKAWEYLRGRECAGSWLVQEVTLLRFDVATGAWQTHSTFALQG